MGQHKVFLSVLILQLKRRAILIVALLTVGSLFFPYSELDGLRIGEYVIRLDAYADLGSFLSGVTALITVALVYMAYSKQKDETSIAEQQLSIGRLRAYESEIAEAIARKQGVLDRVKIGEWRGDDAIKQVIDSLNRKVMQNHPQDTKTFSSKEELVHYYESEYQKSTISVYHRYMYWLMKRIDSHPTLKHTGDVGDNLKHELIMRMRAEMSIDELVISLVNSRTALGSGSYAKLTKDYKLHEQLRDNEFIPFGYMDLVSLLFD